MVLYDRLSIIPSSDGGIVREIEAYEEWHKERGRTLGPNKSAIIILDSTWTISIIDIWLTKWWKQHLIEHPSKIFNLCWVDVSWRIVDSNQCVVNKDLLGTIRSNTDTCISRHRSKSVIDWGNDPNLEHIVLIEASNSAINEESVSHAWWLIKDLSDWCSCILKGSVGIVKRGEEFDDCAVYWTAVNHSAAIGYLKSQASIVKISGRDLKADKGPRNKDSTIVCTIEDSNSSINIDNALSTVPIDISKLDSCGNLERGIVGSHASCNSSNSPIG